MAPGKTIPKNSSKHLVFLINTATRGGGGKHVLDLLEKIPYRTTVIVGEAGPMEALWKATGASVVVSSFMGNRYNVTVARTIGQIIADLQPTIIHAHGTRSAFLCALLQLAGALPCPFLYTEHGLSFRQTMSIIKKPVYFLAEYLPLRLAQQVICVAKEDFTLLSKPYWGIFQKLHFIPNGVDLEKFSCAKDEYMQRKVEFGIRDDQIVIGVVARLVEQKGVDIACLAVQKLIQRYTHLKIIIIGDGPLRAQLESLVAKEIAAGYIQFIGERDDIPVLLNLFDIYVLTSRWEGLPIGLLEAMAAGCAIVATRNTGNQEIITHKRTGLLVAIDNVAETETALDFLILHQETRIAYAKQAKQWVAENYDIQSMQQATYKFYQQI